MSFYDSERIKNKNQKFVISKAYTIIRDFQLKGLNDSEIIACLEVMLSDSISEFKRDILNFALKKLKEPKEDS